MFTLHEEKYKSFFIQLQRLNQMYNEKYFIKVVNSFLERLSKEFHFVF